MSAPTSAIDAEVCRDPVVLDQWHPVAAVDEMSAEQVETTLLLGSPISLTLTEAGDPIVWRGHDRSGPTPSRAEATALPVRTDFGYVWTSLGDPPAMFEIPEVDEPGRIVHNAVTVGVNVSAPRAIENFLDVAHLAFVHDGSLGAQPHTEILEYDVEAIDGDIIASGIRLRQPQASAGASGVEVAEYVYRVPHPYCGVLYKRSETLPDRMDIYAGFAHALSEEWIRLHLFDCVVEGSGTPGGVRRFVQGIVGQDKTILENQYPKRLPLDPQAETPVRADKSSIAYRRWLSEIGITYGVIRGATTGGAARPGP